MKTEERKYGLSRTAALLDALGNPDEKLKIIHIAGTNGKGSTAAFISSVLKEAGKKVGTFTSPQVYTFEEQVAVNGVPLKPEILKGYMQEVDRTASGIADTPTPFERLTAAALLAFERAGCEYAVVECGLGGKDDATNAIAKKEVAVITSVSLEHTKELGSTIEQICAAKSGIIKDCPVVVNALQSKEAIRFFKKLNAVFAGEGLEITSRTPYGQSFEYNGETYTTVMLGDAQCYNAATAIEVCSLLHIPAPIIKSGVAKCYLAGRIQLIRKGKKVYILDGAHNPAAFAPLIDVIMHFDCKKSLVFGCLSDKDVQTIADTLSMDFVSAVIFPPDIPSAMDIEKIRAALDGKMLVKTAASVTEA
ncbi:MAG: hypothetical protein K2N47_04165, partial [Clostridia bacterium]|nr:hypothetical protein [Clostridia bacterium]